jgi:DNA modification methylase
MNQHGKPDLFGFEPPDSEGHLTITPVSVIDLYAQKKSIRRSIGGHSDISSRQEYSPFPEEVARLCFELYLRDSKYIFDPFAGWGERGFYAREYGKKYRGFDISHEAIKYAANEFVVCNTLADSAEQQIPKFDGLITCPPYWNLERYTDAGMDSAPTWKSFLYEYWSIFERVYAAAKQGATFCIQVGDWRSENVYYDLAHKTRSLFEELGATTIDDVIVSRKNISKIKVMLPQAKRLGYTVKTHEYLLVFKKTGDNTE